MWLCLPGHRQIALPTNQGPATANSNARLPRRSPRPEVRVIEGDFNLAAFCTQMNLADHQSARGEIAVHGV